MNLPLQNLNFEWRAVNSFLMKDHEKYFVLIDNLKRLNKSIKNFKI
jgi:hypothetical protein